ncbi:hypothetical protein BJY00DRAFT_258470 [Aspergillus carlsbadensis]|nr:hypothetical protein BJY00DRAFT_258470 [Aspergillus carlsbadensis]
MWERTVSFSTRGFLGTIGRRIRKKKKKANQVEYTGRKWYYNRLSRLAFRRQSLRSTRLRVQIQGAGEQSAMSEKCYARCSLLGMNSFLGWPSDVLERGCPPTMACKAPSAHTGVRSAKIICASLLGLRSSLAWRKTHVTQGDGTTREFFPSQ